MKLGSITLKGLFVFWSCFTFISCTSGKEVKRYDIDKKIDEYWPKMLAVGSDSARLAAFHVCDFLPPSGWDKVYTVAPYTPLSHLKRLNLGNYHKVKEHFRGFKYSDFNVGLLFVKENEIVQYSITSIKLNFSTTSFFSKEDCPNLRVERASKSDTTHFKIVLTHAGKHIVPPPE